MVWPEYHCSIVESYTWDEHDRIHVDPKTVGQFTGLLDKNGKEIYEGDKIRFTGGGPYAHEVMRVFWHLPYLRFSMQPLYVTSNNIEKWGVEMGGDARSYEILGNIYENPELLEEK